MGRHSGAFEYSDAMRTERIGARRAALMAERSLEEHGSSVIRVRPDSSSRETGVINATKGATRIAPAPFSVDSPDEASVLTLEVPYASTHVPVMKNSRMVAAMVVAAASMLGAATAVSADSPANHVASHKSGAKTLASLSVPGLQTDSAQPAGETTFTIKIDGSTKTITTDQPTLGDALRAADVHLGADDKVSASLTDPAKADSTVTIVRVSTTKTSESSVDAHTTTEVEDPELAKGERVVETEGVDGLAVNTYDVTLEDGVEVSRVQEMTVVKTQRVDEVVRVGTKEAAAAAATTSESTDTSTNGAQAAGEAASTTASASVATSAVPSGDAQSIALSMMASYGWGDDQFSCLVPLWQRESGWRSDAANPSSSARGIPQAMMSVHFGANWQSNPAALEWMNSPSQQISWGLNYIAGRYGNPCGAWAHSQSTGWY